MPLFKLANFARHACTAAVFNTVLAGAITLAGFEGLGANLLYSQLIGMTIWALIDGGRYVLAHRGWYNAPAMAGLVTVGVLVGYFAGTAVGDLLLGYPRLHGFDRAPATMTGFLLISLAAGGFGTYFFTNREKLASARLAHAQALRQASEARLKLLETQLEPHMLFNTLANLRVLMGTDPARAQTMLDHLVAYLRATLDASRATTHPLATEFDRLRDYLELMAVRMGPRLQVTLDLPPELAHVPVPTLLLQPLVENSIKHGLEPQVAGGHITVTARAEGGQLLLDVADTGRGLHPPTHATSGFGLAQVRERLHTLYGSLGTLELIANNPTGMRAKISFPLVTAQKSAP